MNKVKKAVVAVAIAAVSVATLAAVGCAGGGAEIDGTYRYLTCTPSKIEQGWLTQNIYGGITTASNNTYSGYAAVLSMYSSDGTTYSPAYSTWANVYGSFEVVAEDDILNETTIKITTVDRVDGNGETYTYDQLNEKAKAAADALIGTEIILTSDYQLAELPFIDMAGAFSTYGG